MISSLKRLLATGPERIRIDQVLVREMPLQELGLTLMYVLFAAFWHIFSDDVITWAMGSPAWSPALDAMRGINFVITSGLVLYLVLRRAFRNRRAAEEALRLSQERFEAAALAATDAIWDLNLETKVVWWSDGLQNLFGYPTDQISPKLEWWYQRVHPDDLERVEKSIQQTTERGDRSWSREYRFRRYDGTYAFVVGRGHVITDATGKPTRLVGGLSDITERRLAEQALENSRQQLRALAARLQLSREEERARISREIHDDLGQVLTAIKLELDWLERRVGEEPGKNPPNSQLECIVEAQELVHGAIESVQRIAADLRPAMLDNLGLAAALREEGRRFRVRTNTACELNLVSDQISVPPDVSIAIFRVFQEALTNVARHAQATSVHVSLEHSGEQITLKVEDDGRGIPTGAVNDPKSLGLLGMSERASALGGQLAIAPVTPHGTAVTLKLPLKRGSEPPEAEHD